MIKHKIIRYFLSQAQKKQEPLEWPTVKVILSLAGGEAVDAAIEVSRHNRRMRAPQAMPEKGPVLG